MKLKSMRNCVGLIPCFDCTESKIGVMSLAMTSIDIERKIYHDRIEPLLIAIGTTIQRKIQNKGERQWGGQLVQ